MEYDYETSRYGLEILTEKLIPLLIDDNISGDDKDKLFSSFFKHIMKVGRLAASKKDEIFVIDLLKTVELIVPLIVENPTNRKAPIALIREIGIESANQRLEHATIKAVILLDKIDEILSETPDANKHDGDLLDIFKSLQLIGEIVVRQKMKDSSIQTLSSLNDIIEQTIRSELGTKELTSKAHLNYNQKKLKYLLETFFRSISDIAFETKSKVALNSLSFSLMDNGCYIIAEKWDNDIPLNILEWLVEIGEFAIEEKNMTKLEKNIIDRIQEIYDTAIKYENDSIALAACDSKLKLRPDSDETWIKKGNLLINFNLNMKAYYAYEEANRIKKSYYAWKGIQKAWDKIGNDIGAEKAGIEADLILLQESDNNYYDSL